MSYLRLILIMTVFCFGTASADVWKWIDAEGKTHYVSTNMPIFTWVDSGKTFYSDTPDHEDAVAVQLFWVSKGTLEDIASAEGSSDGNAFEGETPEERAKREDDQAHYCKRATEIYDSYKNAPRLYRTDEDGEREYLSEADVRATMSETKAKMNDLCK